jgi:hypothetical protein
VRLFPINPHFKEQAPKRRIPHYTTCKWECKCEFDFGFFAVFGGIKGLHCMVPFAEPDFNPEGIGTISPRLARFREGLPWVIESRTSYPEGVKSNSRPDIPVG